MICVDLFVFVFGGDFGPKWSPLPSVNVKVHFQGIIMENNGFYIFVSIFILKD